jgi:predicted MFS family arabinose efflux permease
MQLAVPSRLLPRDVGPEAGRLVLARGLRGFADGMVSVLLAAYLLDLGFSAGQVGVLITATLIGSAMLTLAVGLLGRNMDVRFVLLCSSALMLATGIGFAGVTDYWPLLLIAFAGTLNPSGGDVSVFLPTEQAVLSGTASGQARTALFARYNLSGIFCAALGALCAGLPVAVAKWQDWDIVDAQRSGFVVYATVAVLVAVIYWGLPQTPPIARPKTAPLAKSRDVVLRLTALFCIDSFAGGFVVQSLLVLWLYKRFDLSVETAGTIFFVAGLLSACSQLASAWLSERIGLIQTMVYTHIPSNVFLIVAALMPTAPLAVAFLLLRTSMSQMDVPARQSYVMSVVPPEERAAAASVTNVPRALASAISPAITGVLLSLTTFGWPLIICGVLKITYDLLLLAQFRSRRTEDEVARSALTA